MDYKLVVQQEQKDQAWEQGSYSVMLDSLRFKGSEVVQNV